MTEEQLYRSIEDMRANIKNMDENDFVRERMDSLLADIELHLGDTDAPPAMPLIEQIQALIDEFESRHPVLTSSLGRVMQSLANMGI